MPYDPESQAHIEWIGYVQPVGLVVSIPALLAAQAHVNRNIVPDHQRFLSCLPVGAKDEPIAEIRDFAEFTQTVLGWRENDMEPVVEGDSRYAALEAALPEYHETLRPTHAVREAESKDPDQPWMMLVQVLPDRTDLDKVATAEDRNWQASPQAKFERLLREAKAPIGLLVNGASIRIVYAPSGETSGYATFNVDEMIQIAGRPIFAALHMLLCEERLFSMAEKQRLPAILSDSRKYQNQVSNALATQVLDALYELVRGFQSADDQRHGELLRELLSESPNHIYAGLLTVLMRLVFVLFAEDRGLLSTEAVYTNHYSVTGLFDRLRADEGRYPDTMDQRYGAWAQLITLFRLVHEGGSHGEFTIPARHGYLFDPDRYPFLEGRHLQAATGDIEKCCDLPHVSDGVVFRVLNNLLILDGERLSYRTLDVEQIGSVYEKMMGFDLEVTEGRSIALKPSKTHGAPPAVNLDALLATKRADRATWLKQVADQVLTGTALDSLKSASTIDDLLAALDRRIARGATPNVVPPGAMVLQPSPERRRSGSHYTPRSLTQPIVQTTLKPILEQLGAQPTPEQLLALKVCDPAMGSGAFLVEACRQLGDELVKSWHAHNQVPSLPPHEDEALHAQRLIAQRCLYGVDKNPMAVDLAKLSLWLATLAKDHAFTFLDHALRCGDSLVGLTNDEILAVHWDAAAAKSLFDETLPDRIRQSAGIRQQISDDGDGNYDELVEQFRSASIYIDDLRLVGDAVVASFFSAAKPKERSAKRDALLGQVQALFSAKDLSEQQPYRDAVAGWAKRIRETDHVSPFHWQLEFPEVFLRKTPGFDAIIGNPPFAGKNTIAAGNPPAYPVWLQQVHLESHGNSDLVAHFFRRAFDLLRKNGTFGLIATNTIGQGDTRSTGLRWICTHGGEIYAARKRVKWPGLAAVVVSVVHVAKGKYSGDRLLDGRVVDHITAFLFYRGGSEDPERLCANAGKSFQGSIVLGMGFTFDDTDTKGIASSLADMQRLIAESPRNEEVIFPYIGGDEVNASPTHACVRYVIDFGNRSEEECRENWPDLMRIVEARVRPKRLEDNREAYIKYWWQFAEKRADLGAAMCGLHRVLATCLHSPHWAVTALASPAVFSNGLAIFGTY